MLKHRTSLPDALAETLAYEISAGVFQIGERLPSIRALVKAHGCSKNTVVQALEQLVASGLIEPKRGSGYYVSRNRAPCVPAEEPHTVNRAIDTIWMMREQLRYDPAHLTPGDGFPPMQWLQEHRLDRYHQKVMRTGLSAGSMFHYGSRLGYQPLRQQLIRRLDLIGIRATPGQLLLTHGANDAMEIVIRYFLQPGDTVLVDEPGYYPLFGKLKLAGVNILGVPRETDGPDTTVLTQLLTQHRPKLFFTQSLGHNPTGTQTTPAKAYQILKLAEGHGFHVVEDDPFADLNPASLARIATLDQLHRVIYLGSFSKSVSAALRVGFIAADQALISDLADIRMLLHVSSSEYAERIVEAILSGGHFAKHLRVMRDRLERTNARAASILRGLGAEIFCPSASSLYLWARFPCVPDSSALARELLQREVVLAPGMVFYLDPKTTTGWSRFNIGHIEDPRFAEAIRFGLARIDN
jgi:DNA-binding transcriptional MocR family regulator